MLTTSIAISTTNRLVTIRLFEKKSWQLFKHININHIGLRDFLFTHIFIYSTERLYRPYWTLFFCGFFLYCTFIYKTIVIFVFISILLYPIPHNQHYSRNPCPTHIQCRLFFGIVLKNKMENKNKF